MYDWHLVRHSQQERGQKEQPGNSDKAVNPLLPEIHAFFLYLAVDCCYPDCCYPNEYRINTVPATDIVQGTGWILDLV